jgi:LmbE family N-acetylglucosaminyl deacetylase
VLAFAPHPDDETFGCGGALALYARAGAQVSVVVLTDGSAQVDADERAAHVAAREAETRAALACLGVSDVAFWGLPDRGLAAETGLASRIAQTIAQARAQVVLAPSLWEIHPDHVAVGRAALAAARGAARAAAGSGAEESGAEPQADAPDLLLYEVGGAQRVNLLVDLAEVWDAKARAMACFASQQARQDYARHIEALNVWRTYTLPGPVRHAEGYTHLRGADLRRDENQGAADAVAPDDPLSADAPGAADDPAAPDDPAAAFLRLAAGEMLARASASQESLRAQLKARDAALRDSVADFHAAMSGRDAAVVELQHQLREQTAALRASIVDFHGAMAQRDAAVTGLERALSQRDAAARAEAEALRQAAARRDAALEALRQELTRREAVFAEALAQHAAALQQVRDQLALREEVLGAEIARHAAALQDARVALAGRDAQFAQALAARDADLADLRARLAHAESVDDQLRGSLLAMERSTSWRLTAPMRRVMTFLRGR